MQRLIPTFLAAILAATPLALSAQSPEPQPQSAAEPAEGEQAAPQEQDDGLTLKEMPGDVLVLESGQRMTGIQILRATPQFYEVEVVDGVKFEVPRRRVKEAIYDDIDPTRDRLRSELFPEQQEVTIASGERVTSALRDQLMAPASSEPLSYRNRDYVEALEELKGALSLNLRIHPSITELPATQRHWTVEVPADRTLLALLREDLVGAFDYLEVIFEADRIVVLTKDAAVLRAARQAEQAPPSDSPPPADLPPSE